jgi:hypothetical protein
LVFLLPAKAIRAASGEDFSDCPWKGSKNRARMDYRERGEQQAPFGFVDDRPGLKLSNTQA